MSAITGPFVAVTRNTSSQVSVAAMNTAIRLDLERNVFIDVKVNVGIANIVE